MFTLYASAQAVGTYATMALAREAATRFTALGHVTVIAAN